MAFKGVRRALFGGGGLKPTFSLPLTDAGSGAVLLVPTVANGSNTSAFVRATVAWTKLASGLWTQVASGTARFCYLGQNTAATTTGGYFTEVAATQLVTPTASIRDMTDVSWVKVTMTAAKTATGIDGVGNSASTITATAGSATILQTLVAAATSRTYSCFIKRRTGTGTIILKQGTATLDVTALINSSTYTLVQLNDNELNVAYGIQITTNGDAIDVDFNQFEAGAFATSPIDNTGTRNADVLQYAIAGNIDGTQGTVYCEAAFTGFQASQRLIADSVATRIFITGLATSTTVGSNDGTNNTTWTIAARVQNVFARYSFVYGGVTCQMYYNGTPAIGTTAFDGNFDLTAIQIGAGGSNNQPNAIMRNVRFLKAQVANL